MKVLMFPHDHEYIHRLKRNLESRGAKISLCQPFHYATPWNFIKLFFSRLFGYKIVHVHWIYVFPFVWLMKFFVFLSKKLGYKFVWTIHNIVPHKHTAKDVEKSRWFYEQVDHRFIHYESNIPELEKMLGVKADNLTVIYHPNFNDSYPNEICSQKAREILGIPINKKVLLCFGQIRADRGISYFVEALKELGNDFVGLVVGEKKDKKTFRFLKDAEGNIPNLEVVEGYVPDDLVQLYFNACDVVVLPYTKITTSGVALLAYAFSRPVISTKTGGVPEVVTNEVGILIPPKNVNALKKAIKRIFEMDYKKMGEGAYRLAKEKFTWEKLAEQTIKVYMSCSNEI